MTIPWNGILVLYWTEENSFDLDVLGSVPRHRANFAEGKLQSLSKGRSLSVYTSLCSSHRLSGVQFMASLDLNLCRDLAEQKGTEHNSINSHTQDKTALQFNLLLHGKFFHCSQTCIGLSSTVKVTILLVLRMQLALSRPFQL